MSPAIRVVVAGTSGGVGTTTVTALLFSALSGATSPGLVDHTGGDLGARLTGGDEANEIDPTLTLHDLGAHADGALLDLLEQPEVFGIVVVAATPAGFASAARTLERIRARHGTSGIRRTFVAAVGVFGRHRTAAAVEALQNEFGRGIAVVVPQDPALAAGNRVPLNRVSPHSRMAQSQLAAVLRERMRARGRLEVDPVVP